MPDAIDHILHLIRQLAPEERRQLLQRLRAGGLLGDDGGFTDRNRLEVAPALPERTLTVRTPPPAEATPRPPRQPASGSSALLLRMAAQQPGSEGRTTGKVVLGAPSGAPETPDPHAMSPLPGQAPERPIGLIFDGGSKGNPGFGYGSYALRWPGQAQQIVQLQFGNGVTNNEAEYDTLIAALEAVRKRLLDGGADPATARLEIRGDSQLVINQVTGAWKCTDERMRTRCDRVRELLRNFGAWQLTHQGREHSVRVLGH